MFLLTKYFNRIVSYEIQWLKDKQRITSDIIQSLVTEITIHLMHILQQYIRAHITGFNNS